MGSTINSWLPTVLVHLGCHKNVPLTGWLKHSYFSQFWSLWSPRSSCWWFGIQWVWLTAVYSLCPHTEEGSRELSEISFIRTLIPFPVTSQRPHLQISSHWVLGLNMNFGGTQIVYSIYFSTVWPSYYSVLVCLFFSLHYCFFTLTPPLLLPLFPKEVS